MRLGPALLFLATAAGKWADATTPSPRVKRQTDAGQCVGPCLADMSEAMGSHMESTQGILSYSLYNEGNLAKFCRSYRRGKLCLEECGASRLRDLMINTFKAIDFICIDHYKKLQSYLPCYAKAEPAFRAECSGRCGGSEELRRIKERQEYITAPTAGPEPDSFGGNIQGLAQVLSQMCTVLDCELDCQEGVIHSVCGQDTGAEQFLRQFATEGARPLERMLWDAGAVNYWPDSCDKLASAAETSALSLLLFSAAALLYLH